MALLQPGDTILGMSLAAGGHLTHGASVNQSGKWFNAVQYGVRREDALIDYDQVRDLAREHKPKLIIAGGSAYPRVIDFARFREIADEVGAYLMVDMAHYAGLIAGGVYPNPVPHAHVTTTTTHKTLRGPRGGMILSNDEALGKKINSAVFPGLQGGPLMHVIAAKAVAFGEALRPDFKTYARDVVDNARALASRLVEGGVDIVSGGTDSHIVLVDLRPKGLTGKAAEASLERAGMTCNKNGIPFDPEKPMVTSGVRLGTPAATTRGFGTAEFTLVGELITEVLDGLAASNSGDNAAVEAKVRGRIHEPVRTLPDLPATLRWRLPRSKSVTNRVVASQVDGILSLYGMCGCPHCRRLSCRESISARPFDAPSALHCFTHSWNRVDSMCRTSNISSGKSIASTLAPISK